MNSIRTPSREQNVECNKTLGLFSLNAFIPKTFAAHLAAKSCDHFNIRIANEDIPDRMDSIKIRSIPKGGSVMHPTIT